MSYCPYCGKEISDDMSFCPGCGASLNNEVRTYTISGEVSTNSGDYRIYISGLGSANKSDVIDLLEDVLGYTTASATNLVNNIPVQIAGNLSLKQAAVVAQAFEEYGVELSVTNGEEVEDISSETSTKSLFNSDGSFLASAAVILAGIGAANRLRSISKPKKPSLLQRVFHSLFRVKERPPVHVRRTIKPRKTVLAPQPRTTVRQQLRPAHNSFRENRPSGHGDMIGGGRQGGPSGNGGGRGRK